MCFFAVASRDNRARANGAVVHAAVPAVPEDQGNQDNPDEEWPRNVLRARIRRRAISVDNLTYWDLHDSGAQNKKIQPNIDWD